MRDREFDLALDLLLNFVQGYADAKRAQGFPATANAFDAKRIAVEEAR